MGEITLYPMGWVAALWSPPQSANHFCTILSYATRGLATGASRTVDFLSDLKDRLHPVQLGSQCSWVLLVLSALGLDLAAAEQFSLLGTMADSVKRL